MAGNLLLESYPLTWPDGQQRTPPYHRRSGRFATSFAQARDELLLELKRLGATKVIISTNVPLRRDGLPLADSREPSDPGVAVYFQRQGTPFVIACDAYDKVKGNMRGVGLTIEALRAVERHGSTQMMEQAFRGFAALPPARAAEASWWEVLGVSPGASPAEIEAAHRVLVHRHHPDRGGNHDTMARINRARDIALAERR